MDPRERRERLRSARLYFVCDATLPAEGLEALLEAALAGGCELIQLRDEAADRERLLSAAPIFRQAADRHGALFLINDEPELVGPAGADGVHVGQDDLPVDRARRLAGAEAIVGLSTHSPAQLAGATAARGDARADYVSVGPVWETPTKPGRPAAGLEYVRHAAAECELPWFAIGSIDLDNVGEVIAAGASRIVVVRAIRDAADPGAAARGLRAALAEAAVGAG